MSSVTASDLLDSIHASDPHAGHDHGESRRELAPRFGHPSTYDGDPTEAWGTHAGTGSVAQATAVPDVADEPIRFFVPACNCGCSDRAPLAGASSTRVGAAVPPAALLAADSASREPAPAWHLPPMPFVSSAPPDPVPRICTLV